MSLDTSIRSAVDQAFIAAGDLVLDATFNQNLASSFNFNTGAPTYTVTTSTVKILVYRTRVKEDGSDHYPVKDALVKSEGLDMSMYNTVTFGGRTYSIESYEYFTGVYVLELR